MLGQCILLTVNRKYKPFNNHRTELREDLIGEACTFNKMYINAFINLIFHQSYLTPYVTISNKFQHIFQNIWQKFMSCFAYAQLHMYVWKWKVREYINVILKYTSSHLADNLVPRKEQNIIMEKIKKRKKHTF